MTDSTPLTRLREAVILDFDGLRVAGALYRSAYLDHTPALMLETPEGYEPITVNLSGHGLLPALGAVFVKGTPGLAESLREATGVSIGRRVPYGPFDSYAYEVAIPDADTAQETGTPAERTRLTVTIAADPEEHAVNTPQERDDWGQSAMDALLPYGDVLGYSYDAEDSLEATEPQDGRYTWVGWEAEPEMTGDGSGDPDKHFLTICYPDGEECALIVHRTGGGKFPLDGDAAAQKLNRAQHIVDALNATLNTTEDSDA